MVPLGVSLICSVLGAAPFPPDIDILIPAVFVKNLIPETGDGENKG